MTILLIADVIDGVLAKDAFAKALSAVAPLGVVDVLVAGPEAAAQEAAGFAGVAKVLLAEDARYASSLAEVMSDLILTLAPRYSHIAGPATSNCKAILPRVAALLDVMILSDVTEILDAETFIRPTYAGNAIQTVKSRDPVKVITMRTAGFSAKEQGGAAEIERIDGPDAKGLSQWIEDQRAQSDRPDLNSAKVVVAGGRGVGSKEGFAIIESLASTLGAAVGASRAAVDSDYAPSDWQVGQTGKVVAPQLYIAVGISGAIQHLAGMKDSKVIVAINKDADAPIFDVADYGLVGDLFEILPEISTKI